MRAFLSAKTVDTIGSVEIDYDPKPTRLGATSRRVQRTRTLDGGYALADGGSAECDRTIILSWRSDQTTDYRVDWLVRSYGQLYLSIASGFYLVAPQSVETRDNRTSLSLLVLSRITT